MNLFNTWLFTMLCPSCIKVQNSQYCKTAEDTGDIVINLLPLCENATDEVLVIGDNPINAIVKGSKMTFLRTEGAETIKPQTLTKGDSSSGAPLKNEKVRNKNGFQTFLSPEVAKNSLIETIAQVHAYARDDETFDSDDSDSEIEIRLIDNVEVEPICRPIEVPTNLDMYDYS